MLIWLQAAEVKAQLKLKPVVTHASCNDNANGSIQLQVTGGTAPYQYSWNTGATTPIVTELNTGLYNVQVKDARGSVSSVNVEIRTTKNITLSIEKTDEILRVSASGGRAPYTFYLNNITNHQNISTSQSAEGTFAGLAPGRYALVVKDAEGCSKTQGVTFGK
jgi:hypothetical protein